jgi:hypothetical protein
LLFTIPPLFGKVRVSLFSTPMTLRSPAVIKKPALTLVLLILLGLVLTVPGTARAQPPKLDVFLLTSQMQAQVLRGIVLVYGDALLKFDDGETRFTAGMAAFDRLAGKLKKGLQADLPGNENISKYYDKLLSRKRQVMKAGRRLLEYRQKGRKLGRADIEPLEKASFQTVYAARQLMRHIVRGMDLEEAAQEDRKRVGEALLLTEMQGHLLNSMRDAFADNLNCNSSLADTFWLDLASFDILVTAFRGGLSPADFSDSPKAKALKKLISLKHDVLMEGEAMYLVAKTCRPDLDAARTVEKAAGQLLPIFETLVKEALK